ncbi:MULTISPECIES: TIGR04104 family putative zinc finger protein [unclassified Clostridium]|uniref:TIGR04104 family putative zinc finger protein n=1 Tax=unclassified Clostridium TaxID=2614128 RepID=UPI00142D34FD
MISCKNCTSKFKYKKILKLLFTDQNNLLKCESCETLYRISSLYRFLIAVFISSPILLLLLNISSFGEWIYLKIFLIYTIYIVLIVLLSPLFVILREVNER